VRGAHSKDEWRIMQPHDVHSLWCWVLLALLAGDHRPALSQVLNSASHFPRVSFIVTAPYDWGEYFWIAFFAKPMSVCRSETSVAYFGHAWLSFIVNSITLKISEADLCCGLNNIHLFIRLSSCWMALNIQFDLWRVVLKFKPCFLCCFDWQLAWELMLNIQKWMLLEKFQRKD